MGKDEIIVKLNGILKNNLSKEIEKDKHDAHVFSDNIKIRPRTLVYMLYFIQKDFDIIIDKKYILDGSFCTIKNIVDIIYNTLQVKETAVVK